MEVAVGREVPLIRALEITPETHGPHGIGYAELPDPAGSLSGRYAPDLIVAEARRRPGEITLVTLGPLTNLAVAVLLEPRLPRLLRRWVAMGGAFRVPGNTTPASEWNIHCDPEAAQDRPRRVAGRRRRGPVAPRALVLGLDVTERARILPADVAALAARAGSTGTSPRRGLELEPGRDPRPPLGASDPIVRFMADALRWYFEFHARYDGFYGAFIHDPLVVAVALDPDLCRSEAVAVDVDTAGGRADGQTIADWRGLWGRRPNADVAVEADAAEFLRRLVRRVGDLAAARRA